MNKSSFIAYNGLNVKQRVTDCLLFAQSSFHDMFVFCQKKRSIAFFLKVDDQHGNELWSQVHWQESLEIRRGDRAGTGEGPWVVDGKGRVREEEEEGRDGGQNFIQKSVLGTRLGTRWSSTVLYSTYTFDLRMVFAQNDFLLVLQMKIDPTIYA